MTRASDVLRKAQPLMRQAARGQDYRRAVEKVAPRNEMQRLHEQAPRPVRRVAPPQPETEVLPPGEIIGPNEMGENEQISKYYESLTKAGKYVDEKPVEVNESKLLDVFKEMSK